MSKKHTNNSYSECIETKNSLDKVTVVNL
jgi:hypothetical protein